MKYSISQTKLKKKETKLRHIARKGKKNSSYQKQMTVQKDYYVPWLISGYCLLVLIALIRLCEYYSELC